MRERERECVYIYIYIYIYIYTHTHIHTCIHKDESKVLQYFGNVMNNLSVLGACAKIVKVMNHTGQRDVGPNGYSPSATHCICLYVFEHGLRIHGFWPTYVCLINFFVIQAKFLKLSGYCPFQTIKKKILEFDNIAHR